MTQEMVKTTYLKDYAPPAFYIRQVHLYIDIHDDHTVVKTLLNIQRNTPAVGPLVLDGETLQLKNISLDGKPLPVDAYTVSDSQLTISVVPNEFLLETTVMIYPDKNTQLMGLYASRDNLCTQCESHGFRRITYFLDRPDVMTRFTTTISADKNKYPFLLSNGNLIEEKMLDNNRHWVRWEDPSLKPCYLFALVAGDFDVITDTFTTLSGRTVDLFLYLEKGFLDQGDYAMVALKKAMRWDEERFGREYDLDRYMTVAVSDFNMGAMENKGLNIFNTKYILAKPSTATDEDYIQIEAVIGHEYFHNWSGNRVTCRDWFQLTLKEGLTVFRDQLFTEDMTSCGVSRIDVVNVLRNQQFPEDAGPMAHPIRPESYISMDNFYTMTVYSKGAEVIRMVRTLLTPEVFRKGMDLYFSRYDGQAVTTEDFISVMAEVSGRDFSQFSRWYHQAGTPVLMVQSRYDAQTKTFSLTVKQSCPATPGQSKKELFHLPLAVGLVSPVCVDYDLRRAGDTTSPVKTHILEITQLEETFTFINIDQQLVPSLLRHFSAPVEVQYTYTDNDLALLFQCDSDPFCRWEAGQRLMMRVIERVANEIIAGKTPMVSAILITCFQHCLSDEKLADFNLLSRLLTLPSLKYLFTHLPKIDLDVIYAAKVIVEKAIAIKLESLWIKLFEIHHVTGEYVFDMSACGHRRVKNLCLYYLLKTENDDYYDWVFEHFVKTNNMSDMLGALIALNDHHVLQREQALQHFYNTFQHEPLVVNKWLSLHASSTLITTLDIVKDLMRHPAFDIKNPNNVYALLVRFGENTLRFHEKSGMGYRFLTDQILKIDAQNPQVAARVAQALTQWQRMDDVRGSFMRAELQRMADQKKLSRNLYEIVTKSLIY